MIGKVDGKHLWTFLVGQPQKVLYAVEFIKLFPLVEQDFTIRIVYNTLFYNGGGNNIFHFLCDYNRFTEILPNGFV